MRAPDWLTARPVAHRGLHDIARGIVENMPAAAQAAVDGNFAIECDIQLSSDGEAMVHHDDALGRLTEGSGALLGKTAAERYNRLQSSGWKIYTTLDLGLQKKANTAMAASVPRQSPAGADLGGGGQRRDGSLAERGEQVVRHAESLLRGRAGRRGRIGRARGGP